MKKQTKLFEQSDNTEILESTTEKRNFQTFSQFIQSSSELNNLIETHLEEISFKNNKFALIGLHSCGNLSNSIVNLYVNSNRDRGSESGCKLLCNVACCYNLLDEKYTGSAEVGIDESSKFPMSKWLNEIKYELSYDLRMLACHSFDRILSTADDFREVPNQLNL